ncbi:E3 ubiquitin-protein ligase Topors-like, partial [Phasianus colchicus]|uniref:E3 ubiquitin-protein ligase Topors-like n=1 Tax=Phasianus colchicus TaxID=9054 RepID=UPI00129E522F
VSSVQPGLVPGLQSSRPARLGVPIEDFLVSCCGAVGISSWCLSPVFPWPCLAQAAGASWGACAAVELETPAHCRATEGAASPSELSPAHAQPGTMEPNWICPICGWAQDNVAYVTPCLHQLCYGCAMWWANKKPSCAICGQKVRTIRYSVRSEDDYLECPVPQPMQRSGDGLQD